MKRPLFALLVGALALLVGCFECEEVLTLVLWRPDAGVFEITQSYRNITLECEGVEDCSEQLAAIVQREEGSPFATPEESLGAGATVQDVHLERRDDALDVVVRYTAPEASAAATQAHLFVEQEERLIGTREHLVLMPITSDRVELLEPGRARARTMAVSDDEGEVSEWTAWSLPKRARALSYREAKDEDITPMLSQVPGLDEALEAKGLLAAGG
ncbi:MAG: hypothetical protein H6740_21080 [Alphaproteobacteria bacterium]|nr:hypothetical protein [Alphaproteobacteria bacterium]